MRWRATGKFKQFIFCLSFLRPQRNVFLDSSYPDSGPEAPGLLSSLHFAQLAVAEDYQPSLPFLPSRVGRMARELQAFLSRSSSGVQQV